MRSRLLLPALSLLAGCAAMQQMQKQSIAQNTAISPNFDLNRVYSLVILPPSSSGTVDEPGDIEGLREFAGSTGTVEVLATTNSQGVFDALNAPDWAAAFNVKGFSGNRIDLEFVSGGGK